MRSNSAARLCGHGDEMQKAIVITEWIHTILIAGAMAAAYDLARKALRQLRPSSPPPISLAIYGRIDALAERVETNERAFKATLLDWRSRFDELDKKVEQLPHAIDSKVAGTVAAIGALPSAPKQWR